MKRNYLNTLFVTILCLSCYVTHAQQWNEIATIDGETPGAKLSNNAITRNGNHMIVGAEEDSQVGVNSGAVRVYELVAGDWVQKGQEILGSSPFTFLGDAIAISDSGNRIIIGDNGFEANGEPSVGRVDVYDFNGTTWETVGNAIIGQAFRDDFGWSVDITPDGSKIAFGSLKNPNGTIMVFDLQGDTWTQIGQDINGGNQTSEPFNQLYLDVKLNSDGTRVIAADPAFNENRGRVQAYELQGDTWVELGSPIVGDIINEDGNFGDSLNANEDLTQIIVSTNTNPDVSGTDSGQAKVFEFVDNDWVQKGQTLLGEKPEDFFGFSTAINESGDIIATFVSLDDNGENSGSVKVFKLINNNWVQEGESILGEMENDNLGIGLSLSPSGDTIYVGVPGKDINGQENVGQIKVFKSDNVLSIDDTAINTIFKVYPNPSITNFDIDLTTIHKEVKVTIIDVVGGKVFNNKYQNTSKIKVAHNLASGLYLVNITAQNTEKQFKLLVK
ncbi:T9SS type A sorting domain-containing protein [Aquimarina sp. RZ0]|uniref:T9SS type A sorting domain-containing protein n=1 Tax=Aquimarina sp. RZ0 TaxID=2607730 RepID=UPI0011F3B6EF|nr:T9SS type A sorting domain-containing protein [Aquimarina sp. RZ0]KAA1242647.1 T9SS type A sorting domain-containing protein [Aquimarina sp. RZ0]